MSTTVFPNQTGRSGRALKTSQLLAWNDPVQQGKQPATPAFTTDPARQNIAKDAYEIFTSGKTLLQSTFTPTDSRRPAYVVTTDVASDDWATTILWKFDPGNWGVAEVARVNWSSSGKTTVEMSGVHVPVTEFLTKSKWRLGTSSSVSFTSEMEEYRWLSQPAPSNAESCVWQCVIPLPRDTAAGLTVLSTYRPSFLREASARNLKPPQPKGSSSHRPSTSESSVRRPPSRQGKSNCCGRWERQPAVLQMYPGVNSSPHLREIILLTAILVVAHKDEWRSLPHSRANVTTSYVVLSHLSGIRDPKVSSETVRKRV